MLWLTVECESEPWVVDQSLRPALVVGDALVIVPDVIWDAFEMQSLHDVVESCSLRPNLKVLDVALVYKRTAYSDCNNSPHRTLAQYDRSLPSQLFLS